MAHRLRATASHEIGLTHLLFIIYHEQMFATVTCDFQSFMLNRIQLGYSKPLETDTEYPQIFLRRPLPSCFFCRTHTDHIAHNCRSLVVYRSALATRGKSLHKRFKQYLHFHQRKGGGDLRLFQPHLTLSVQAYCGLDAVYFNTVCRLIMKFKGELRPIIKFIHVIQIV